jgi:transposase
MAVVLRLCKHCQTSFPSKTQRALYCSHTCNKEYHRNKTRELLKLESQQQSTEESSVKENQRQQDTAEHLRAFIAKHCHQMTPEQVAYELQVPLFAVKMLWPNPSR